MLGRRKRPLSEAASNSAVLEKDADDVPEAAGTWKQERDSPPAAVSELASAEFIHRLREGGPLEFSPDEIPAPNADWVVPGDPEGTARHVAELLCTFRFDSEVVVNEMIPLPGRGKEFLVSLALADGTILGSCFSDQVRKFDKDLQYMLQGLNEVTEGERPLNLLRVQTQGVDHELQIPEDLWRCELFPCKVIWFLDAEGEMTETKYLQRVPDEAELWKLADTEMNRPPGKHRLTQRQMEITYNIPVDRIKRASVHMDARSQKRLRQAKLAMQAEREAATNVSQSRMDDAEGSDRLPSVSDWLNMPGVGNEEEDLENDLDDEDDQDELWDLSQGS